MNEPCVLWYTPVSNIAGVGRHLLDTARAGIPGFRVIFALPDGPLADALRETGAAVVTGNFGVADGPRASIVALRNLVKRVQPSIVHTHLAYADLIAMVATRGLRSADGKPLKRVSTEHGIAADSTLYQANKIAARLKLSLHSLRMRLTDRVIAVSESTADQIRKQWGDSAPIAVILNGVDPVSGVSAEPGLKILSLSRLSHEKRIEALIEGFALLARDEASAMLTIAGEGPDEEQLRAKVTALGLVDRVEFPGFVDADQALRTHDVVAQLSAWENLSYTLLDAVAYGRGVVASDVGGNSEIVPRRCLIDPSNPEAVARALKEQGLDLKARPKASERIGAVSAMTGRIAEIYQEVLA